MIDLKQLFGLLVHVRNPLPAFFDKAGLANKPYRLETREGLKIGLRSNGGDRYAFYENLICKAYLSGGLRLSPGDTVIDIGANIGCFSVLAAQIVGPDGHVLSIEPDPASYCLLDDNILLNSQNDWVTTRQVAVGGHNGTTRLISGDNALFGSIYDHVDNRHNSGNSIDVELVTLEKLMDDAGIQRCHLLKVDCEGAEYDIFKAMTDDLSHRIDQIAMEVHSIENRSKSDLTTDLERLGYNFHIDHGLLFASRTLDH